MAAELYVEPGVHPLSWESFTKREKRLPKVGAIALDGYVSGAPQYDESGPFLNANHHEGVNRLATLSTAQQIHQYIRLGMLQPFTIKGEFQPRVYVNDCDQDVCLAWYLLTHTEHTSRPTPPLNRLLQVAGTLDVTAGAFPYPKDMRIIEELAWVFEPYTNLRNSDDMALKDSAQYRDVIHKVDKRITKHIQGEGKKKRLDTRYEIVGGAVNWKMISEKGVDGKIGALMDGIDAYVTVFQYDKNTWRYTVGRRSEFIPFDVPKIISALNEAETNKKEKWGGADIVAGSPRVAGSKLSPDVVEAIINSCISKKI